MENFYKEKLEIIQDKYKKLYIQVLREEELNEFDENMFSLLTLKTVNKYPEMKRMLYRINNVFSNDMEDFEKMNFLLKVYPRIKESFNLNSRI